MSYSEGNAYTRTGRFTLYERGLGDGRWQTVRVVESKAGAEQWVSPNVELGWQKFAYEELTK